MGADSVSIILWEYGKSIVETLFDSEMFILSVLDTEGTKHKYYAYLMDGKPYLKVDTYTLFPDEYTPYAEFIDIQKSAGTVKFHIVSYEHKDNTYSFSIENEGFAQLYEEIAPSGENVD